MSQSCLHKIQEVVELAFSETLREFESVRITEQSKRSFIEALRKSLWDSAELNNDDKKLLLASGLYTFKLLEGKSGFHQLKITRVRHGVSEIRCVLTKQIRDSMII